jgi:branched-chain amino acid aminotransferase
VGELAYQHHRVAINRGRIGETAQRLYDTIVGIQYGIAPDTHSWTVQV